MRFKKGFPFLTVIGIAGLVLGLGGSVQAQSWVARYEGINPGYGRAYDYANDVAVDANGNVYVTGESYGGTGTKSDYATVKYAPDGTQLWARRFNGTGNRYDFASAIAVDRAGNVVVTGSTNTAGNGTGTGTGSADYTTIKYDADGTQLWVRHYNGPANGEDYANDIAIDTSGYVYVTGQSAGTTKEYDYDYATVKYAPDGTFLRVKRHNGSGAGRDVAVALAIDARNNVIVTGYSLGSGTYVDDDYVTIKYSPSGTQLWRRFYTGAGSSYDYAADLAVDASGNVVVTGTPVTVKYSPGGTTLWTRTFPGNAASAVAVDGRGNAYVTGFAFGPTFDMDYATIKYDGAGAPLWTQVYDGPGSLDDEPSDIGVDNAGNVVVTGKSYWGATDYDYATIRYTTNGAPVWVRHYDGPATELTPGEGAYDFASALALDNAGNVFVTGLSDGGSTYEGGTDYDYATIKYTPAGD